MEALMKHLEDVRENMKIFLGVQHLIFKLLRKKEFYKGTPKYAIIEKEIENKKIEYNNVIEKINTVSNYEEDLLQEYIDYVIKYEFDNPNSTLINEMDSFTYDLHQFVNSLALSRTANESYTFGNDDRSIVGLLSEYYIELMDKAIADLKVLQFRWKSILEEEKILIEDVKDLEKNIKLWNKYKNMIEQCEADEKLKLSSTDLTCK